MDLILCIFGCATKQVYKNQILKIEETFGKLMDSSFPQCKRFYFLEESQVFQGEQFIHLPGVKDDYLSASFKQWYGLDYIYRNYNPKFIMCIGTDTYVHLPNLLDLLSKFDPTEPLYIGGHGCFRTLVHQSYYFHSGGSGFILSYASLQSLYPRLKNISRLHRQWEMICKRSRRLDLIPACDVAIAYFLANYTNTKTVKVDGFWGCNYKGIPCHVNENIDPFQIISCHNMSLEDFDEYTKILNSN
jgi:hypothetical protein